MGNKPTRTQAAALITAAICLAGCAGPKPTVFDQAGIDAVHKLLVVPLDSPHTPAAGVIATSLAAERLQYERYDDLTVFVAPAMWRLRAGASGAMSDNQAAALARQTGADTVLTGKTGFAVVVAKQPKLPGSEIKAVKYTERFAVRSGAGAVHVRILAAQDARTIYAHNASAKGIDNARILAEAVTNALKPLETYLRKSRK